MIPLFLTLSGFLSYRQPTEVDFTSFDLACISGANGAGKSSLLDALTWVLFGQARKRDDSMINSQSSVAEVSLTFSYEGNIYRVQRTKPRDKTQILEFHILQEGSLEDIRLGQASWKPLTERTLRDTETHIEKALRMDYDTFVNAAFFLQGKADLFTQQRPGDRKRILGSILGLEIWETYRQRANERRRTHENEIGVLDGRLNDIDVELAEEDARKERLKTLEDQLARMSRERLVQESALENIRKIAATLVEQRKLLEALRRQTEAASRGLEDLERRCAERQEEKQGYAGLLKRAAAIEAAYTGWQAARQELERWEEIAGRFREQEQLRLGPRDAINAERARLAQELDGLAAQQRQVDANRLVMQRLQEEANQLQPNLDSAEARLSQREALEADLQGARQAQADARAENPRLRQEMEDLKSRIDQLKGTEGATCPVCGGPLSAADRLNLIAELEAKGKEMGARFRANQDLLRKSETRVSELEAQIRSLSQAQKDVQDLHKRLAEINTQRSVLQAQEQVWNATGAARQVEVVQALKQETYAMDARRRLAEIDAQLKEIGYDAAQHDAVRRREQEGRNSEMESRQLEMARAALEPLSREVAGLEAQIASQGKDLARQQEEFASAAATLAAAEAQAPDLESAERDLYTLQEQENQMRLEVGAARQKVAVLKDLKKRKKELESEREALNEQVKQLRQLERAFGKDGVPALLIEQALPEIEGKANQILDRLSGGTMSVRFVTQAAYKDKKRDDLRETLDIQISDGAGTRDYEMYSGGEAFRVNFAIRLALSEVLAQRAGARLQTLVIDEGFGSQDSQGRQRLLEAISLVRPEFAKVLVITHLDELKDAFPNRLEVEKLDEGSTVRVI